MKFCFATLGCKVNQFETQALAQLAQQRGHVLAEKQADVCIINTCTVTSSGDHKTLRVLHKLQKENPNAIVALCGCFAQTEPERRPPWTACTSSAAHPTAPPCWICASRRCATAKPSARSRTTDSGRRLSSCPPVFCRDTPAPCSRYRTAATTTVPTASFRMRAAMCALCRSRKPSSRRSNSPRPVCGKLS